MYILINKELDEFGRFKQVCVCGSIKALTNQGIIENDDVLSYDQVWRRVSKNQIYNTKNYFIRYCKLITSKKIDKKH